MKLKKAFLAVVDWFKSCWLSLIAILFCVFTIITRDVGWVALAIMLAFVDAVRNSDKIDWR